MTEEQKVILRVGLLDRWAHTVVQTEAGRKIVFLRVDYDPDPYHPLDDCDGMGSIHSFCTRHANYNAGAADLLVSYEGSACPRCGSTDLDVTDDTWECNACYEADRDYDGDVSDLDGKPTDAVPLSYYEHSLCRWAVQGALGYHNCHHWAWDGTRFAGVWEPDPYTIQQADDEGLAGADREQWMRNRAAQACEVYTHYCNGWVYLFDLLVYPAKYVNGDPEEPGSLYDLPSDYRYEDTEVEACVGCFFGGEGMDDEVGALLAPYGIQAELAY